MDGAMTTIIVCLVILFFCIIGIIICSIKWKQSRRINYEKAVKEYERYNREKELKTAKTFYLRCVERKIKTTNDIAANFSAIRIIADNVNVKVITPSDAIALFEKGYEAWKADEKATEEKKKEKESVEKQKLKEKDKKESDSVKEQANIVKEEKYIFKLRSDYHIWYQKLENVTGSYDAVTKLAVTPVDNGHRPDAAIMGGLAAGITGSNVIGAAVAYQTEQSNKQRDSATYISKSDSIKLMDAALDRQIEAEKKLSSLESQMNAFRNRNIMYDSFDPDQKIKMLSFSNWKYTVRESDNIDVVAKITLNQDVKILDSAGFLDGSLKITCYRNNAKVGVGYYCAPGFGDVTLAKSGFGKIKGDKLNLKSICIIDENKQIKDDDKIDFKVEPINMWITEIK